MRDALFHVTWCLHSCHMMVWVTCWFTRQYCCGDYCKYYSYVLGPSNVYFVKFFLPLLRPVNFRLKNRECWCIIKSFRVLANYFYVILHFQTGYMRSNLKGLLACRLQQVHTFLVPCSKNRGKLGKPRVPGPQFFFWTLNRSIFSVDVQEFFWWYT